MRMNGFFTVFVYRGFCQPRIKTGIESYLNCITPSYKPGKASLTLVTGLDAEEYGALNQHYCLPCFALSK